MLPAIQAFYNEIRLTETPPAAPQDQPTPEAHTRLFYKEYPRFERIELPEVRPTGDLQDLLDARRSYRDFLDRPLALEDVSALLTSCRLNSERDQRTYPSGGMRYPVEFYLMAFRVEGLETGCYHYAIRRGALEVLWPADLAPKSDAITSVYSHHPAAAIVMTSVLPRAHVKYGVRAYPLSLLEAGHAAQTIQLAAAARGLGTRPICGFVDSEIAGLLDLTDEEIPIYVLAAGHVEAR